MISSEVRTFPLSVIYHHTPHPIVPRIVDGVIYGQHLQSLDFSFWIHRVCLRYHRGDCSRSFQQGPKRCSEITGVVEQYCITIFKSYRYLWEAILIKDIYFRPLRPQIMYFRILPNWRAVWENVWIRHQVIYDQLLCGWKKREIIHSRSQYRLLLSR